MGLCCGVLFNKMDSSDIMDIVSVIVPVYRTPENSLRHCIDSILTQTYDKLDIILVDDGSPDNCGNICDDYVTRDHRIKVFHKENGGVSSARNFGLQQSSGKYVLFVDSDDWLEQNAISILIANQHITNADLLICGYYAGNAKICKKRNNIEKLSGIAIPEAIAGSRKYVMGYLWNKLFHKQIIDKFHLSFDEKVSFCEDSLFCQEYASHCDKVICISQALYHYENNLDSVTHAKVNKRSLSVLTAYESIISFCAAKYHSSQLLERLYANYYCHYIRNLRRIKNELSSVEQDQFKYVCDFVKINIKKILLNKKIHLKTKLLALALIIS